MKFQFQSLLLTLPALFTLACDPPDAHDTALDESEFAEEDVIDDVSVAISPTAAPLPATVAQHPAFAPLSQRAYVRIGNVLAVKSKWTPAKLETSYEILEYCRDMSSQSCVDELSATTLSAALTATEIQQRNALNASFHLDQMSVPDRTRLLQAAQAAHIAAGGAKPPLILVPSTFENGAVPCDAACKTNVLSKMGLAQAGMMARMTSTNPNESPDGDDDGGGSGGVIGVLIDVGIAIGGLIIPCWLDPDRYCWPEQNPNNPPPECNDNSDCASDEYCWEGPLGVGTNECRDKKVNGSKCGNDDACLSNCCNFNFFGSKCDVPSKCN